MFMNKTDLDIYICEKKQIYVVAFVNRTNFRECLRG